MGFDLADVERILKLVALVQAGATELSNILANKRAQMAKSDEEIFDHAEQANKEAKALIDAL